MCCGLSALLLLLAPPAPPPASQSVPSLLVCREVGSQELRLPAPNSCMGVGGRAGDVDPGWWGQFVLESRSALG